MSGKRLSRDRFLERRTTRREDDADPMGHRWEDDGHLETGEPARRCQGCQCRSHWPIASQPCLPVRLSGVRMKLPAQKVSTGHPPNRTCARAECGERYFSSHPRSMYCSQRCAFLCHRRQQTASQRRLDVRARGAAAEEAKARAIADALAGEPETELQMVRRQQAETPEQKAARLKRQRDARREEAAARRVIREAAKSARSPAKIAQSEANAANYAARKARWEFEARPVLTTTASEPEGLAAE